MTRSAKPLALEMWKRPKRKLRGCHRCVGSWNRDAFRDAALLVSGDEGAQAIFVSFAQQTNQTAVFLPLR